MVQPRNIEEKIILDSISELNTNDLLASGSKVNKKKRKIDITSADMECKQVDVVTESNSTTAKESQETNSAKLTKLKKSLKQISPRIIVADMMAGVGPFAIPLAKTGRCLVYANGTFNLYGRIGLVVCLWSWKYILLLILDNIYIYIY